MIIHITHVKDADYSELDLYTFYFQVISGTPSRQEIEKALQKYDVFSFHYSPSQKTGKLHTFREQFKVGQYIKKKQLCCS